MATKQIFNPLSGTFDTINDTSTFVEGPASATDNAVARFDATTGKLVQNSSVTVSDAGIVTAGADGVSSLDLVTKQQLDAAVSGVDVKASVIVATTANITLSGEQTIDGVLTSGSRVLVKNQSTTTENGIYVSSSSSWTRSSDANSSSELTAALVTVQQGSTQANTGWYQITDAPAIGTDPIVWNQFFGAGTYTADGQGIELSGSTFSLELDGSTLSKSVTGVKVATQGISNNEVSNSAAIAYSKLNLTSSIVNADISNSAAIAYSKLSLSNSIVTNDIQDDQVSNGKLANMATQTIKGRTTAGSGDPEDLTASQATAILNTFVGDSGSGGTKGLVVAPASGDASKFLRGDATWQTIATGTGDVVGPASATDNAIARFDSTTGKLIQNSVVTVGDTGAVTGVSDLTTSGTTQLNGLTASRVVQTDASKNLQSSTVTTTELGYVSGVTSGIQAQINGKQTTGNYITALTGDVTATGPGSVTATIASDAVTNAKLANMATQTIKGRTTAGSGDPEDLTAAQATAILDVMVGDSGSGGTKGLAPAPASGDTAAGKFLRADATYAIPSNLVDWSVTSKTANYTAVIGEYVKVDASSGAFTITLPTAVGNTGKRIAIDRTDQTLANKITIATTSSQTIDGVTTKKVSTQNEKWVVVSDGSNWRVEEHRIPGGWTTYTPTFTGFGTVSTQKTKWRRVGSTLVVTCTFVPGTTTATIAKVDFPSGLTSISDISTLELAGTGAINVTSNGYTSVLREPSVTYFTFGRDTGSATALQKYNGNTFVLGGNTVSFTGEVEIVDWED